MKKICSLLFLLFTIVVNGQIADTLPGSYLLSARYHYGFVLAHRPSMIHLQQKHLQGIEVEFLKPLEGSKDWQQQYNLPLYGIAAYYFNLGNDKELGKGYAIAPRILFPLNKNSWMRYSLGVSCGLGYIEKPFDPAENYKNVAIGSHFNAVVGFNFRAQLFLKKSFQLAGGIALTHFSNGTIKQPNLGINIFSATVGVNKYIGKELTRKRYRPEKTAKKNVQKVFIAGGLKAINVAPPEEKKYGIALVSYASEWSISSKSNLGTGMDLFYDPSLPHRFKNKEDVKNETLAKFRTGIRLDYELKVEKLTMLFQNGLYITDQFKSDGVLYTRIGFQYSFNKKMFAGFHLKTHLGKADFFEYALGYNL